MENAVDRIMSLAEKYSPDQVEAYGSRNRLTTIRMAVNEIVEAKSIVLEGVSLRLILNKSVGFASSTDLSEESLSKIVEKAYKIAKAKKPDPDFKSLPEPKKAEDLQEGFDRRLMDLGLIDAVKYGKEVLKTGLKIDPEIDLSGSINVVNEECKIGNSLGVDVSDVNSFIFSSLTVEKGEEVSAIGQTCSRTLKGFDPVKAVGEAVEATRRSANGRRISPGKYEVIFGPQSFAELAEYVLTYGLALSSVDSGFSYFRGCLGKEVAIEDFKLIDDGGTMRG